MKKTALEMKNIHKQFPGVYALDSVCLEVKEGEVHALLGENGAGKSTLIKVLGGIYIADEGEIYIGNKKVNIESINDSKSLGISIIHQELILVPHMSIAENIFLGREIEKSGFVSKRCMHDEAQKMIDSFDMRIDASKLVCELSVAQQQMVEIVKAVSFNARIIVMDEPTSSLTEKEVDFLFKTIDSLREKGVAIIYISHRIEELFKISDRITVMRDGKTVGTVVTSEIKTEDLIKMMVGRELVDYYSRTFHEFGEVVLEVRNINRKGVLENISFSVRKGEILGFSGLVGAGRSELMRSIFGIDPMDSGEIYMNGQKIEIKSPQDSIRYKMALVPENRKQEGLVLINSVSFNMTLTVLKDFIKFIGINHKKENHILDTYINGLAIKTPSPQQIVGNLSGGNQQKVVISKWLAAKPKVLIMDEPTRGVDVGAKAEIYSIINQLAAEGVAIVLISSELPEVINMSDTICVMYNGKIRSCLERKDFTQERIMHYATGGN